MNEKSCNYVNPEEIIWLKFYAMFSYDPNVTVFHFVDIHAIDFHVSYKPLADLFRSLLPNEATYGTAKIKFLVNSEERTGKEKPFLSTDFKDLFQTNPLFSREVIQHEPFDKKAINKLFILFKKKVVQVPSDNWGSPFNVESFLAEDLMRELLNAFEHPVALFSTELE